MDVSAATVVAIVFRVVLAGKDIRCTRGTGEVCDVRLGKLAQDPTFGYVFSWAFGRFSTSGAESEPAFKGTTRRVC